MGALHIALCSRDSQWDHERMLYFNRTNLDPSLYLYLRGLTRSKEQLAEDPECRLPMEIGELCAIYSDVPPPPASS